MIRRIAVCDDEPDISRQISLYLKQIESERGDSFEIFYYSSGDELLRFLPPDTDVLLLDIGMNGLSGMDTARQLRGRGSDVAIIFITSMTEYAMEGYEVHAFSFLAKPIQYAALRRSLYEVFAQMDQKQGASLVASDNSGSRIIDLNQLLYAEVLQHQTSFVFLDGRYSYKLPLSDVEKQAAQHGFFRCHKSYLVSFRKIEKIDFDSVIMCNGDRIPISKHRRKDFLSAYARFMGVQF